MTPKEEKKQSIPKREEAVLRHWEREHIFEKTLKETKDKDPYVFYDGPPFATGLPHYGHLLAGTIKDIIPRYQTMRGHYVRREWGWDCHGLPLENLIEKELGLKHKRDIEAYGVENFNQKARESVLMYDKEWKEIVPRMGRWADMEKSYKTMDATYTESIWWSFKTLYDKKLIYEGYKSMHICPRCETTLAISEVGMNYKDTKDLSVYVKFELKDEPGTYLIAWTTTPWTLPGNVAVAVNRELEYVKIEDAYIPVAEDIKTLEEGKNPKPSTFQKNTYVIAKDRLANLIEKKYFSNHIPKVLEEFKGEDLVGKTYVPLFDYYVNDEDLPNRENAWKVVGADFVTTEDGTGIVHEAPAFGEEDMELAKKLKLPLIQHVAMDGTIKPEARDFAGMQAKPKEDPTATDVEVIKVLAKKGLLFAKEKIEHSYPFCWRCDTPLLNYAASSWFVNVTALKPRLLEENARISWVPENMKDGRFGKWLEGARDWAISRSRYWGAPLPVWKCNKCGKVDVIGDLEQLKERTASGNTYFVIRHGEAETNAKGVVNWKIEGKYPLTKKGVEQVRMAAKDLKEKGIELIIASPLERTKESAHIIAEELGINGSTVIFDPRIAEVNTGEFDGRPVDEYRRQFSSTLEKFTERSPGGETLEEMRTRCGEFLYDIDEKHKEKKILIVTHEYVSWMFDCVTAGATNEESAKIRDARGDDYIENAEVREFLFAPIPHGRTYELDFHRPYIDEITFHCTCELGMMERIKDVFDCWYESGSMPFASVHYLGDDKMPEGKLFRKIFPADFIAEGLDQTRGWFYSLIILSVGLFDQMPYRSVIVNGLILAEDGQKMSKKLKNYPDPMEIVDRYGADTLRLYLIGAPVVRGEELRFSERGVDELYKKVALRLDNVWSLYDLNKGDAQLSREMPSPSHVLDQWIISRLGGLRDEMTSALDSHELDRAARAILPFIDDLSTWYIRRSRERLKSDDQKEHDPASETTGWVLFTLLRLLAPIMPFLSDDLYLRLPLRSRKESVHLESWPEPISVNAEVLSRMARVREYVAYGLEQRAVAGRKVRQPLASIAIPETLEDAYAEILMDELNVEKILPSTLEIRAVDTVGMRDVPHIEKRDVILHTEITPALKEKGMVRDIIRAVQDLRKRSGRSPKESIILLCDAGKEGAILVRKFSDEIRSTTRASDIVFSKLEDGTPIELDGVSVTIALRA